MKAFVIRVFKFLVFLPLAFAIYGCSETPPQAEMPSSVNEFAQSLQSIDPQSAASFSNFLHLQQLFDSLTAAENEGSNLKTVEYLAKIANNFRQSGNYIEGIRFYRNAISHLNGHDPERKVEIYHGLAAIYYELFLHFRDQRYFLDSASCIASRAFGFAKESGCETQLSDVLNLLGAINIQNGNYTEAVQKLNKAYSIKQKLQSDQGLAVLNNLASAYAQLQNYDTALYYIRIAYKRATQAEDLVFAATSLEILSNTYLAMGDTVNARLVQQDREQLIEQDDHLIRMLIMKQLYLNYERRRDGEQIKGMLHDRYYFVRLSWILLGSITLLILALVAIFRLLRQEKRLHNTEMELSLEKERTSALQIRNVTLELEEKNRKEQVMKEELEYKQGVLTSKLLHISNMITFLNQMKEAIHQVKDNNGNGDILHILEKIDQEISKQLKGNIWEEYEMLYAAGNNSFIERLMALHPDLTPNEKRLSYLIMSNFTTKEIANILSKSYRSVEMARFRLRTKLGLDKNTTLEAWFGKIINHNH
jgi:DNA-binding CsgD family transcriptional regulator/tetratricopeptide (TPR) repeat protein